MKIRLIQNLFDPVSGEVTVDKAMSSDLGPFHYGYGKLLILLDLGDSQYDKMKMKRVLYFY